MRLVILSIVALFLVTSASEKQTYPYPAGSYSSINNGPLTLYTHVKSGDSLAAWSIDGRMNGFSTSSKVELVSILKSVPYAYSLWDTMPILAVEVYNSASEGEKVTSENRVEISKVTREIVLGKRDSLKDLKVVEKYHSDNVPTLLSMAHSYAELGKDSLAQVYVNRAKILRPNDPIVLHVEKTLHASRDSFKLISPAIGYWYHRPIAEPDFWSTFSPDEMRLLHNMYVSTEFSNPITSFLGYVVLGTTTMTQFGVSLGYAQTVNNSIKWSVGLGYYIRNKSYNSGYYDHTSDKAVDLPISVSFNLGGRSNFDYYLGLRVSPFMSYYRYRNNDQLQEHGITDEPEITEEHELELSASLSILSQLVWYGKSGSSAFVYTPFSPSFNRYGVTVGTNLAVEFFTFKKQTQTVVEIGKTGAFE